MAKEFWLNLPVKNLQRSKEFFEAIGFRFGVGPGNTPTMAPLLMGQHNIVVLLCEEPTFQGFVSGAVSDAKKSCEVLLSIDASGKEEVDEMVEKVIRAGGSSNHKPYEIKGPMYGCVFSDLDGHKWNVLFIDRKRVV